VRVKPLGSVPSHHRNVSGRALRQFGSRFGLCLGEVSLGYLPVMRNKALVIRAAVTLRVGVRGVVAVSGLFGGIQH
jgi:hypothetical protein